MNEKDAEHLEAHQLFAHMMSLEYPPVRKAWIGWWVDGRWCPTEKIRDHQIRLRKQQRQTMFELYRQHIAQHRRRLGGNVGGE